jgi:hypothetical protein
VYNLPCTLADKALPGYYNVSATIGDEYGTTEPNTRFFRIPNLESSSEYSLSTYWEPRDDVPGTHMIQVAASPLRFFVVFIHE